MKKIISILMLFILAFSLIACSSPFDDDSMGEDEVEGKVTIRVGIRNDPYEKAMMNALKREFEKQNNLINIKYTNIQSDYHSGMATYIKKPSDMPDIIWTAGDYYSPYSSQGIFVDLSDYYASDPTTDVSNFVSSVMDLTHYGPNGVDDGIYFAPRDYNKPITIINTKIFEAAGIEIPTAEEWNYDKFLEICEELRLKMDTNQDQESQQIGLNSLSYPVEANLHWQPVYYPVMKHFGADMIDENPAVSNEDAITVNNAENVAAYNKIYNDLVKTRYTTNPADGDSNNFVQSKAAMVFEVRPNVPSAVAQKVDVDFLPFPFDYDGAGCSGYAITNQARERKTVLDGNNELGNVNDKNNEELAWEFIKFMLSEKGQETISQTGVIVPVRQSLWTKEDAAWNNYVSANLHHEAFISGADEKDINLNVVHRFPAQSQILMQKELDTTFNSAMLDQYHKDGSVADALQQYLNSEKEKMITILKTNS